MTYEIKMLDLIDIELESSFLVLARNMGIRTQVKTWGFLILGRIPSRSSSTPVRAIRRSWRRSG